MRRARPAIAAAMLRELRTPLARVALAASQLERASASPAGHALALCIHDAVAQMDAGIGRMLPLLSDAGHAETPLAPLTPVVRGLLRRLGPAIAARDTRLVLDAAGFDGVRCDPHSARRAIAALLQAGSGWLLRGGEIRFSAARDPDRFGLRLECIADDTKAREHTSFRALETGCGGSCDLEIQVSEREAHATLWLAPVEIRAA